MGVPIDRGLTQGSHLPSDQEYISVEMGVPTYRGLTHVKFSPGLPFIVFCRNGCPDI